MKSLLCTAIVAGALLAGLGLGTASAQVATPVEFTTTFPFSVGTATVPAGTYRVSPADDQEQVLELSNRQKHIGVFFPVEAAEAVKTPRKTEVVFLHYGDKYVLENLWVEGEPTGAQAMMTAAERREAKSSEGSVQHVAAVTRGRTASS